MNFEVNFKLSITLTSSVFGLIIFCENTSKFIRVLIRTLFLLGYLKRFNMGRVNPKILTLYSKQKISQNFITSSRKIPYLSKKVDPIWKPIFVTFFVSYHNFFFPLAGCLWTRKYGQLFQNSSEVKGVTGSMNFPLIRVSKSFELTKWLFRAHFAKFNDGKPWQSTSWTIKTCILKLWSVTTLCIWKSDSFVILEV